MVLAYLGDNVYEYYVRRFLIEQKISNVNDLQKTSINYVSAKNQAKYLEILMNDPDIATNSVKLQEVCAKHAQKKELLDAKMELWEELLSQD